MNSFKKNIIILLCLLFTITNVFAASGKKVVDIKVQTENIDETEEAWLKTAIEEKVEANLSKYTSFHFINLAKINNIFSTQALTEGDAFDQDSSIEFGKIKKPDYQLYATVKKVNDVYTLSMKLTDLTTGLNIVPLLMTQRNDVSSLSSMHGCAVDELTIDFCDSLGTPLTSTEQVYIMNGDVILSSEEKQTIYDTDIKIYNEIINNLNVEINLINSDTSAYASIEEEKLKADKALAQEKLRIAEEKKKAVEEMLLEKKREEAKDNERTKEQQNRISSMAKEMNDKIKLIRNERFEEQSLLGKINLIELKKQAILNIYWNVSNETFPIYEDTLAKLDRELSDIINTPYRAAELDTDGVTPAKIAVERREKLYSETRTSIIKEGIKKVDTFFNKFVSQMNVLIGEIQDGFNKLKTSKISTLGNELIVKYGPYDGNSYGWKLYITLKSDGVDLFETTSFLPYEKVTGIKPTDYTEENYSKYLDDVDFYNSLFLRGEPIFVYELSLSLIPDNELKTSKYSLQCNELKCYDTSSLKNNNGVLSSKKEITLNLKDKAIERQINSDVDIHPIYGNLNSSILLDYLLNPTKNNILDATRLVMVLTMEEKTDFGTDKIRSLLTRKNNKIVESWNRFNRIHTNLRTDITSNIQKKDSNTVLFGNWPQSVKEDDVTVDNEHPITINGWECYEGSDGHFYVKLPHKKYDRQPYPQYFANYKKIDYRKDYYFKYEPIEWKIITDDYDGSTLLMANNVLDINYYDLVKNDTDYANSSIRKWLNDEFIKKAFTESASNLLKETKIDNSFTSTRDEPKKVKIRRNGYKCDDTKDKVFLLSTKEATTEEYGFTPTFGKSTSRKINYSDYTKAKTIYADIPVMLRSTYSADPNYCYGISQNTSMIQPCLKSIVSGAGVVPCIVLDNFMFANLN